MKLEVNKTYITRSRGLVTIDYRTAAGAFVAGGYSWKEDGTCYQGNHRDILEEYTPTVMVKEDIPNEDLIRAVLDGKTVQCRSKTSATLRGGGWADILSGQAAIVNLVNHTETWEYRLKPETIVKWCRVSRGNPTPIVMGCADRAEAAVRSDAVLRIELEPDTLKVISATTEEP